jgi:hypothetical protein
MVQGAGRRVWADRGCVAVDMETGLLDVPRIAAVRVVLDTPDRELSPVWAHPLAAVVRPDVWPEGLWLWRIAPRLARRAAAILAAGLASSGGRWTSVSDR